MINFDNMSNDTIAELNLEMFDNYELAELCAVGLVNMNKPFSELRKNMARIGGAGLYLHLAKSRIVRVEDLINITYSLLMTHELLLRKLAAQGVDILAEMKACHEEDAKAESENREGVTPQ